MFSENNFHNDNNDNNDNNKAENLSRVIQRKTDPTMGLYKSRV